MGAQHRKNRRTGTERGGARRQRGTRVNALVLCAALSSLIFLLGLFAPVHAAPATGTPSVSATAAPEILYGKTNTGSVNARAEPSTKAPKLTTLRKGSVFPILGSTVVGQSTWYQVELDGSTAYIRSDLVELIEEADALAPMESQQVKSIRASSGNTGGSSSSSASSGAMVWLSATGGKYHRRNNCGNMNPDRAEKVTLEEAQRRGKTKCKKCY